MSTVEDMWELNSSLYKSSLCIHVTFLLQKFQLMWELNSSLCDIHAWQTCPKHSNQCAEHVTYYGLLDVHRKAALRAVVGHLKHLHCRQRSNLSFLLLKCVSARIQP